MLGRTPLILALLELVMAVTCANLPSSITPCRRNEPALNHCITTQSRKMYALLLNGYPELGVPSMRPMRIKNFVLSNGFDGLHVNATNASVRGMKEGDLKDFRIDFMNKTINMRLVHNIHLSCRYVTYGKLLQIPMSGDGNLEVFIKGLDWNLLLKWDLVKGAEGKDHMRIKKSKSRYELHHASFKFDGMLNEDIDIAMNKIMNDNWRSVVADLGDPGLNVMQKKIIDIMNTLLSKVPYEVLFPV